MKFSNHIKKSFFYLTLLITSFSSAQDISVHDPVMIKQKDTYYLYCTGEGISVFSSKDLKKWNKAYDKHQEAYEAYKSLPEEVDAWRIGGQVKEEIRKFQVIKYFNH